MAEKKEGAIILAAGESRRFGGFKPLFEINGRALVEWTIDAFIDAGIEEVVVVAGYRADELWMKVSRYRGIHWTINREFQHGQTSSALHGYHSISSRGCDGLFLSPIDCPPSPETISTLLSVFREMDDPNLLGVVPTFQGRKGHPPIFRSGFFDLLEREKPEGGASSLIRRQSERFLFVPVRDERILLNINTVEDAERFERMLLKPDEK